MIYRKIPNTMRVVTRAPPRITTKTKVISQLDEVKGSGGQQRSEVRPEARGQMSES